MAEILPDELLAAAVVDRGVDQVDSPVEHRVQQPACLLVVNRGPPGPAPPPHGPVPAAGLRLVRRPRAAGPSPAAPWPRTRGRSRPVRSAPAGACRSS